MHLSNHPLSGNIQPQNAGAVLSQIAADIAADQGILWMNGEFDLQDSPFVIPQGCIVKASDKLHFNAIGSPVEFQGGGFSGNKQLSGASEFTVDSKIQDGVVLDGCKYFDVTNFTVFEGGVLLKGKTPDGSLGDNRNAYGCTGNRVLGYRIIRAKTATTILRGETFCTRNKIECQQAQSCETGLSLKGTGTNRIQFNTQSCDQPVEVMEYTNQKGRSPSKFNRISVTTEGKKFDHHVRFDRYSIKNHLNYVGVISVDDPSGRNYIRPE